jgi:hypothetical protein
MLTIKTKTINICEVVNTLQKTFSPSLKIKIQIKFYNERKVLIEPKFYFITKNFESQIKLSNYIKKSYTNFKRNNIKSKISKYEINIIAI